LRARCWKDGGGTGATAGTAGTGIGGAFWAWLAETYEADDALVEVDDDREKVKLALVDTECSESLDICEVDR